MPHVRLFIEIALSTGARSGAILGLKWDRVDLQNRRINLGGNERQKARAQVVPINDRLYEALVESQRAAMTEWVIEWAGEPVKSIKRGFHTARIKAGLDKSVTPHVLRHTAASWMAEAGIPMSLTTEEHAMCIVSSLESAGYVVVPKERWIGASAYSIDLQRIIEALCERRPLPEPKTTARFHYDMAQKFLQAKEAGE